MASTCIHNQRIFSCKFSPFEYGLIACTTANKNPNGASGGLQVFNIRNQSLEPYLIRSWTEPLLDFIWDDSGNLLTAGSADGILLTWSTTANSPNPVILLTGHKGAILSIIRCSASSSILSGAIDGQVKQWDLTAGSVVSSFQVSDAVIQIAASSSRQVFVVTADRKLSYVDFRTLSVHPDVIFDGVQSCDISFHDPNTILIGSSAGEISVHDIRMPNKPCMTVKSHQGGIRRVRTSKFLSLVTASAGFDGCTVITDLSSGKVLERVIHHSDVVYDVDCSHHDPFLIVDCSWDSLLHSFHPRSLLALNNFQRHAHKL